MLPVRHWNQRIRLVKHLFHLSRQDPGRNWESVYWKWPKCSLYGRWRHSKCFPPTIDSFDLVAGYCNFDRELLEADQHLFNQFKKTHVEKSIKTAAEVIDALCKNNLHEITPEFSKVASTLAVIPATSSSEERSFSRLRRLKTYLRNNTEQHRLNNLAIICIERAYGNQAIVNSMD